MNNLLTHYPVNWIDGMKLSSSHFIAVQDFVTDSVRDAIALDIWSPYMDECYFQIANYVNEPILYRVHIETHFHDKIDIQDHYPNKELSKLNDMYQIYQNLWEKYEMNKSKK